MLFGQDKSRAAERQRVMEKVQGLSPNPKKVFQSIWEGKIVISVSVRFCLTGTYAYP
jgi:hypothetical protein